MSKKNETVAEAVAEEVVETVDAAEEVVAEVKAPVVKIEIIRGRMPLPIVHMIKFGDAGLTDGAMAAKFRTTNGKVSDVRKDRNFGYVKEDYVPSGDMIAKAKEYAAQLDDKSVLETLEAMKPASDEQNAAFDAARKATRPVKEAKAVEAKEATPASAKVVEEAPVTDDELAGLTE